MISIGKTFVLVALGALLGAGQASAGDKSVIVQSTTSTANSGLYDHLLPLFKADSGITVHVVAVAPARRSKTRATATATYCWCTPNRPSSNSSPTATVSPATT